MEIAKSLLAPPNLQEPPQDEWRIRGAWTHNIKIFAPYILAPLSEISKSMPVLNVGCGMMTFPVINRHLDHDLPINEIAIDPDPFSTLRMSCDDDYALNIMINNLQKIHGHKIDYYTVNAEVVTKYKGACAVAIIQPYADLTYDIEAIEALEPKFVLLLVNNAHDVGSPGLHEYIEKNKANSYQVDFTYPPGYDDQLVMRIVYISHE